MTAPGLADRAEAWAVEYAAGAAGPPVYADTVRATGLDPIDARARWDAVTRWYPWGGDDEGHTVRTSARW